VTIVPRCGKHATVSRLRKACNNDQPAVYPPMHTYLHQSKSNSIREQQSFDALSKSRKHGIVARDMLSTPCVYFGNRRGTIKSKGGGTCLPTSNWMAISRKCSDPRPPFIMGNLLTYSPKKGMVRDKKCAPKESLGAKKNQTQHFRLLLSKQQRCRLSL